MAGRLHHSIRRGTNHFAPMAVKLAVNFGSRGRRFAVNDVTPLAPWVVPRRAGNLDAPVIHYLSIDEAIDCDSAHRKTFAGVRKSRPWISDIFAANGPSHDHFVFRRDNIIDGRLAIRKNTWPQSGYRSRPVQAAGQLGKLGE
jgi:hypothetical protein